ncbi:MAG: MaoC/PaaZ C-terminal domain-containing protein [Actinomycetota bacterium]
MPDSKRIEPRRGLFWEELPAGTIFVTGARTITETDLVTLTTFAGINEPLFIDARRAKDFGYEGRLVPGVLTYTVAEGLIVQTGVFHDTGMAFLGATLRQVSPVYVGDTIHVEVEVTESRASSKPGRGVVASVARVLSDRNGLVLEYTPIRLVRSITTN